MTVHDLIIELQKYPPTMMVVIRKEETEFTHAQLEGVNKKKIGFSEEPNGKKLCSETVIELTDEL